MKGTYTVLRSPRRRRSISLSIDSQGRLLVRAPQRISLGEIERVVGEREEWVRKRIEGMSEERMRWLPVEEGRALCLHGQFIAPPAVFSLPELLGYYKRIARKELSERLGELSRATGLKPTRFRLSSARTRWGSCSSQGSVSLNWRLLLAPPAVADYVILHELAHLDHHDHSRRFWNRVKELCPSFQQHRLWLKNNSRILLLWREK